MKNEDKTGQRQMRHHDQKELLQWLIVDGYNMIGAWEWLQKLAQEDVSAARDALMHTLLDYAGWTGQTLLLVFDAYDGEGAEHATRLAADSQHQVVYTNRGQTADQYIERFVREHDGDFSVASSDGLVQVMIFAHATRISARELAQEIERKKTDFEMKIRNRPVEKQGLSARLSSEAVQALEAIRLGNRMNTSEKEQDAAQQIFLSLPSKESPVRSEHPPHKKRRNKRKKSNPSVEKTNVLETTEADRTIKQTQKTYPWWKKKRKKKAHKSGNRADRE